MPPTQEKNSDDAWLKTGNPITAMNQDTHMPLKVPDAGEANAIRRISPRGFEVPQIDLAN
jgi:hypothetical protein